MISTASAQFSSVQQKRVGALMTHHPAWMSHHTGGSRQGHPRYTGAQTVGRPWVARLAVQSAVVRRPTQKSKVMCLTKTKQIHRTNCHIMIRKKNKPLDAIIRHFFFSKVQNLTVFQINQQIRIRSSGSQE